MRLADAVQFGIAVTVQEGLKSRYVFSGKSSAGSSQVRSLHYIFWASVPPGQA